MTTPVTSLDACVPSAVHPDKVALARAGAPQDADVSAMSQTFRLLGDPTRVRLLHALLETGELCVCDLAAVTGSQESAVSHALRLLRTAGVVASRRDGRNVYYRLADAHVRMILDLSREHVAHDGGLPR